jgi:hypothetical protein
VEPTFAARLVAVEDTPEAIDELAISERWGDGLPVVPPTPERVRAMLRYTDRRPDQIVARIAPGFGEASVERIAINAVLAGCQPCYLPVVIAAVEAVAEPTFNLQAIQTTTNPVAVMLLVNGPAAAQLGINAGHNCLGQGWRANATLGRALRLILQNIGRALPGDMDRATQGQPGKYSMSCAENEAANPWEPLHVERGFEPTVSTVTVIGAAGTINVLSVARETDDLLKALAGSVACPGGNDYLRGGYPVILLGPEHAAVLARTGLSKAEIKQRLWRQSRIPARDFAQADLARLTRTREQRLGPIEAETLIPIADEPSHLIVVVAGGPGTHSTWLPTFGLTTPVTRPVIDSHGVPITRFGIPVH